MFLQERKMTEMYDEEEICSRCGEGADIEVEWCECGSGFCVDCCISSGCYCEDDGILDSEQTLERITYLNNSGKAAVVTKVDEGYIVEERGIGYDVG